METKLRTNTQRLNLTKNELDPLGERSSSNTVDRLATHLPEWNLTGQPWRLSPTDTARTGRADYSFPNDLRLVLGNTNIQTSQLIDLALFGHATFYAYAGTPQLGVGPRGAEPQVRYTVYRAQEPASGHHDFVLGNAEISYDGSTWITAKYDFFESHPLGPRHHESEQSSAWYEHAVAEAKSLTSSQQSTLALSVIDELRTGIPTNADVDAYLSENGALVIEWVEDFSRFAVFIDPILSDSTWHAVRNGQAKHGLISDLAAGIRAYRSGE